MVLDCAFPSQLPTAGTFAEIMLFTAMVAMLTQAVYEAPPVAKEVSRRLPPEPAPLDFSHSDELIEASNEAVERCWHYSRSSG